MKKTIIFIYLILPCLLYAQVTFNPDDLYNIAKGDRDSHTEKFTAGSTITTPACNVIFYRCFWVIDPSFREISGNVTVYFIPLQPDFDSLLLDMNQTLTVDTVIYHNQPSGNWNHTLDQLFIFFSNPLPQNVIDSFTVYYHGIPPDNGFGTFVRSFHNGVPIIWTLSEPYGASDWWPCKNGLTDKADSIEIIIKTPDGYKGATNGILNKTVSAGGSTTYYWKHRYPIATYLVGVAVTNYAYYTQLVPFNNDTLKVINYVYPEDSAEAAAQTAVIVPMIQLFDSLFGIYPFQREKYGHAQFGWGGGMEHQTMTFITTFQFELMAHELAHMWFGDMITCGTWTDIWLNEGFATYLSGLCYEHLAPEFWERFREVRINQIVSQPGGSVYCPDTTNISRIFDGRLSYAKGAMILHQLRWIIGDSAFFTALNNYLNDFSLAYGFARTENLKSHLESTCGQDLTWYFDEWYTGEGYPQYQINWTQKADTVSFTVSQSQSTPAASFFELPVQLKFKNTVHDTLIRVTNSYSGQLFTVQIPFTVDSLIFDPGSQIISGGNTVSAIAEHWLKASVQVVPNPATDHITFRIGNYTSKKPCTFRIYDDFGRIVEEFFLGAGQTELILDTQRYPAGIYYFIFGNKYYYTSGKFIIQPGDQ